MRQVRKRRRSSGDERQSAQPLPTAAESAETALGNLRESLRALFEDQRIHRPATGVERLRVWMAEARRTGRKSVERFCGTLERWREGMANDFLERSSNGRREGFNHGLRSIHWRAFGLRSFEHVRFREPDAFGQPGPQES